jgi:hypothetical protein
VLARDNTQQASKSSKNKKADLWERIRDRHNDKKEDLTKWFQEVNFHSGYRFIL